MEKLPKIQDLYLDKSEAYKNDAVKTQFTAREACVLIFGENYKESRYNLFHNVKNELNIKLVDNDRFPKYHIKDIENIAFEISKRKIYKK